MAAHDEGLRHRSAAASGGTVDGGTVDGGTPQHWSRRAAEAREAAAACRLDSMLQLFALITHGATQAASLLAWRGLPPGERFQRVASTLLVGLFWVLPTFAPRFHMRHRKLLIVTSRVQFFLWPLLRQPRGVQKVLDSVPQAGLRGLTSDIFKVVWGTRLVAVLLNSLITPLPLLSLVPHVLIQLYAIAMVRGNRSVCAAPLLLHAKTVGRIRQFHSWLSLSAFILPGGVGHSMHSWLFEQDGGLGREGECEAFLNFLSLVVGLLLPVVLAIKTEPPASLQRWERSAARGGGGGPTVAGGGGKKVRLRDALARANLSLEGSIRHACGRSWLAPAGGGGAGPWLELQPWERGLALWLTLSMLWALAVVAARA